MTAVRDRLLPVVARVVEAAGYDLEDLRIEQAGRRSVVRVVVDKDGGVSLDDVAEVTRVVSEALDEEDERASIAPAYTLEVSSPGVSRPLTQPRHWRRNRGRLVTAALREGGSVTGRIAEADDDAVTLDVDGAPRQLRYDELSRGTVQVEFSRPGEVDR